MPGQTTTVPAGDRASLLFTEDHLAAWSADPASIGLSVEDITAITGTSDSARSGLDDRTAAVAAAKASTITWHAAAETNRDLARELVRKIRFFATQQADPDAVYAAAQIPAPKTPGELPVPAVPTDLNITLDTQGRAVLRFESSRFGGTVWGVQRRTTTVQGQTGAWADLTTVLEREFVDGSTPQGMAAVAYRVRAERPSGTSAYSAPATLTIGAGGNQQAVVGAIAPVQASGKQAG